MPDTTNLLEEALEDARKRLQRAHQDLDLINEGIADLEIEVRGLEMALDHRRVGAGPTPKDLAEWRGLSRTSAILRLLMEEDEPLSPKQISDVLLEKGRDRDSPHYVSAALSYLQKTRKVENHGRGRWAVRRSDESATESTANREELHEAR